MEYCPFILFQNLTMPCEISKDGWIGNIKIIYKNSSLPISFLSTKERIFTMRIWGTNYTIPNSMEKNFLLCLESFCVCELKKFSSTQHTYLTYMILFLHCFSIIMASLYVLLTLCRSLTY